MDFWRTHKAGFGLSLRMQELPFTSSIFHLNLHLLPTTLPPPQLLFTHLPWKFRSHFYSWFLHGDASPPPITNLSCVFNHIISPMAWKKSSGPLHPKNKIKEKETTKKTSSTLSPLKNILFLTFYHILTVHKGWSVDWTWKKSSSLSSPLKIDLGLMWALGICIFSGSLQVIKMFSQV